MYQLILLTSMMGSLFFSSFEDTVNVFIGIPLFLLNFLFFCNLSKCEISMFLFSLDIFKVISIIFSIKSFE